MPEAAAPSPGKGARVVGFFVFQLGAGVILDGAAHGLGAAIAGCGLAVFVWGLAQLMGADRKRAFIGEGSAEGPSKW